MRKLIYLLLLLPFITKGQTWQIQNVGVKTTINSNGSFAVDSVLRIPIRDTAKPSWWNTTKSYDGSLQIGLDGKLYYYYGGVYIPAGSGGSGSGTVTSISQGYGITNTPNPITTTGTIRVDTTNIASKTFLSNRYVPYVGATANLNLGTYNLMPNGIQYSVSPTATTLQRLGYWDAGNQTVSINVDSTNGVSLQLGQEQYVRASNKTGAAITNGSVVYINGAQGNRPTIRLAQADSGSTSLVIGVATQDIANNAEGFVTTIGVVNGFNTSSFTAGDELYLSPTSEGVLTNVAPSSPYFTVPVAIALNSTNNGSIFVHAQYPLATDTLFTANENRIAPTQKAVKTYVDKRVKYTDTATMLAPYLRKADTASLSNRINAKQDALTLTTTGTSGAATLIGSTLNIPNYATGSGTVTSIATTNGTGITGGTITTSGTLAIDTTLIATRSWRKKGDDSLGALIGAKVNYTDTASMLTNYVRSASNGITKTSQNVALGGSLTGATTITTTGTNTLAIAGLQSGTTNDSVVVADATSGVLKRISSSRVGGGWSLTGNAGTTAGTNFVGTTDAVDFVVKRNNVEQIRLQSDRVKLTGAIQGEAGAGDIKLLDGASNQVFRGIRSAAWSDYVNSMFFQVGNANDYALFSAASGSSFNRFMIQAERFQISNAYNATAPTDRFEILSQTTGAKVFAVDNSGNAKVTTTTGMLVPPVMTATQAEAISSKSIGGIIYSTDGSGTTITSSGWWGWNGTTWNKLN